MREIDLTTRSDESMRELLAPVATAIRAGQLVIVPTMTYYALACDALNPDALRRVFSAKRRSPDKPLIVLVDSLGMVKPLVADVPDAVKELEWRLGSKGLTYVLEASERVPSEVTAGSGTVAVRVERNEVIQELLSMVGQPIVAPSANVEGAPPPRRLDEAVAPLRDWIELAVRWWPSRATAPSTLVDLRGRSVCVVREGTVSAAEIERVLSD